MSWSLGDRARELRPQWPGVAVRGWWPVLACLALALFMQLVLRPFLIDTMGWDFAAKLLVDAGVNIVLAVSLTMVNGFTGQFSIGHAAFMAVGGYTAAAVVYYGSFGMYGDADIHGGMISGGLFAHAFDNPDSPVPLVTRADVLFLAGILAGGVMAAASGYLVGLPSLRLRGDYLAIVTLGFGEIVRVLIQSQTTETLSIGSPVTDEHLASITAWQGIATTDDYITAELIQKAPAWVYPRYLGGSLGFSGLPSYSSLFWVYLLVFVTLIVAWRIKKSSYGRALLSIREDEIAAEAMGVNTTKFKIRAFVISAFFAGCAGALFAHTIGVQLNAGELGFVKSFDIIIMVVLGGLGSISGSVLAAIMLTLLPEMLRKPGELAAIRWFGIAFAALGALGAAYLPRPSGWRSFAIFIAVVGAIGTVLGWAAWAAARSGLELANYRMVLYASALILMMILRPQGLLGVRELWELWTKKR